MWLAASAGQLISFKMDLALRLADWDHYCEVAAATKASHCGNGLSEHTHLKSPLNTEFPGFLSECRTFPGSCICFCLLSSYPLVVCSLRVFLTGLSLLEFMETFTLGPLNNSSL